MCQMRSFMISKAFMVYLPMFMDKLQYMFKLRVVEPKPPSERLMWMSATGCGQASPKALGSQSITQRISVNWAAFSPINSVVDCFDGLYVGLKQNGCNQNYDVIHFTSVHENSKLKNDIGTKPSIQIKFGLHHCLSYARIFKTRSQLPMFARYFLKIFSLTLNN